MAKIELQDSVKLKKIKNLVLETIKIPFIKKPLFRKVKRIIISRKVGNNFKSKKNHLKKKLHLDITSNNHNMPL